MRAVVARSYGGPDVLGVEELPKPVPVGRQVLVRNRASVVTAAVCAARSGRPAFARLFFGLTSPKWPVLGTNFSGVVEAVGHSVTRFAPGDRIAGVDTKSFGAHAEYMLVDEDGSVVPAPAGLSDIETVAVFDGAMTALPFLTRCAQLRRGESILINGASGAVGIAAIQLAKHLGAHVTAVCSTRNLDLVRRVGADRAIDYTKEDFTQRVGAYDVIFDAVGRSSFGRSRRALARRGIYLTTVPTGAIMLQQPLTAVLRRRRAAIAFTGLATPAAMREDLTTLGRLAEARALVAVIGTVHPMERASDAHRHVDGGHKVGSAVILLSASSDDRASTTVVAP